MKIEIILIQITKYFIYRPIQLTNILLKVQIVILYKKGVFSFKKNVLLLQRFGFDVGGLSTLD